MRDIKFRAWDKNNNDWFNHDGGELYIELDGVINFGWNGELMGDCTDRIILLQYTGLYDKNGKEVYEGDILFDDHHDEYGLVRFEEGKFSVLWETTTDDLFENCDVLELSGNIYENPELLED